MSLVARRQMIEQPHLLSLVRQCDLLGLPRSGWYYQPVAVASEDLALMVLLDKQYLKTPFYGYRKMTKFLQGQGYQVNHKRVRRLLQLMGIAAIPSKPNTSQPNQGHKIYPYLLKGLSITNVNQVWATDITYVPMERGFMYLMAILDLYSRYVLEWSVSNTMEAEWCTLNLAESH